jgi:hypothetical protein
MVSYGIGTGKTSGKGKTAQSKKPKNKHRKTYNRRLRLSIETIHTIEDLHSYLASLPKRKKELRKGFD